MKHLRAVDTLESAMECVEAIKGEGWNIGASLEIAGGALVSGSNGGGDIAHLLIALVVKDSVDLSRFKESDKIFEEYVVLPGNRGKLVATQHIQVEVSRLVQNIEFLCSYFDYGVSLKPLFKLADTLTQSLQFTKEYFESLILSKPLSRLVLTSLLKRGKYDAMLADLFRFHINKCNEYGYVGLYLKDSIKNLGYLSGRILATMEQIASLSENTEPLRIDYSRFSTAPTLMLSKLQIIAKKYIYTVSNLGRQIYLKNLLDSLLESAKEVVGSTRYLSDNDQAMFAIGYKHQGEYFADEEFISKFPAILPKGA